MGTRRIALLLGIHCKVPIPDEGSSFFILTENARQLDLSLKGMLGKTIQYDGPFPSSKKIKVLDLSDHIFPVSQFLEGYSYIVIVDIGSQQKRTLDDEKTNQMTESLMSGIARGLKFLKAEKFGEIHIDTCGFPSYVGTATALTIPESFPFDPDVDSNIKIKSFDKFHGEDVHEFEFGITLGKGQNLARELMRMESFSDYVGRLQEIFSDTDVQIQVRNDVWMEQRKMGAILSTAKKTENSVSPLLLEIRYSGIQKEVKPLVLVGKASLFDSTFLPIRRKPEIKHYNYRSGMGGASCIIGCIYALSQTKAATCIVAIMPLVENQQSLKQNAVGNVVHAMNGRPIKVNNPSAEGRLMMADALCYASLLDSSAIVDVTSLMSEIDLVLGTSYMGVFTKDDELFEQIRKASRTAGERVWRLPLFRRFTELLSVEDKGEELISNVGEQETDGMPCKAAAFLQEFVTHKRWMHIDITGIIESKGRKVYLSDWATGRSTRTLIHFCMSFFKPTSTIAPAMAVQKLLKTVKTKKITPQL